MCLLNTPIPSEPIFLYVNSDAKKNIKNKKLIFQILEAEMGSLFFKFKN